MEESSYLNLSKKKYYTASIQPIKVRMAWNLMLTIQFIGLAWTCPHITLEQIAQFVQPLPQANHKNPSWYVLIYE